MFVSWISLSEISKFLRHGTQIAVIGKKIMVSNSNRSKSGSQTGRVKMAGNHGASFSSLELWEVRNKTHELERLMNVLINFF